MTDQPSSHSAERRRLLRIYLNDHLAGATVGVQLARRCLRNNGGTPLGDLLERFITELTEDRASLLQIFATLDLPVDRVKVVLGSVGEKVGRLKLNGRLRGYSDLSRLWELEGLCAGVDLKLCLWRSLGSVPAADARLATVDLDRLIERAVAQRAALEDHRLEAARRAFRAAPAGD